MKATFHKWCKTNRNTLKIAYNIFLEIFNDKYNLQLVEDSHLYNNFCKYMYESSDDVYGVTLFDTIDDYKKYCRENKIEYIDEDDMDSIYDEEDEFV